MQIDSTVGQPAWQRLTPEKVGHGILDAMVRAMFVETGNIRLNDHRLLAVGLAVYNAGLAERPPRSGRVEQAISSGCKSV
jgi:hypothetical protein